MQLHDVVFELDEPVLLAARQVPERAPMAWLLDRLGVECLLLRRFAERPGTLGEAPGEPAMAEPASPAPVAAAPS